MTKSKRQPPPNPSALYRRLKRWFDRNARRLPWRGLTEPYRIWISEVMLVQTTVAAAVKRYPRFLRRFPTLKSLAEAPLDDVMKEWEGLGYYHRARYLHQAAQIIRSEHRGRFPSLHPEIRALPGVGDYVAAAVANFSFGARVPAVDANIARVMARLGAIPGDVRSSRVRALIHNRLSQLMITGKGALWTDGLIEVGAVLCLPRRPNCPICPLRSDCQAFQGGHPERYGLPGAKPTRSEVAVACGIIRRPDGRILIAQRPETGLLPGLWEFPGGKRKGNERLSETCLREIKEELGISVRVGRRRMVIRHAYSHYHVRLHVFECVYEGGSPQSIGCQRWRWVRPAELSRYAFPTANREIIADLMRSGPQ